MDDISCQATGSEQHVSFSLGVAGNMLAGGLADLRLPLASDRTKFICSSTALAAKLEHRWQHFGYKKGQRRAMWAQMLEMAGDDG